MLEGRRAPWEKSRTFQDQTKRADHTCSSKHLEGVTRPKQKATFLPVRKLSYRERIYQSARAGWGPEEKQVIKHIYSLGKSWSPPFSPYTHSSSLLVSPKP